jgi:hypothetical protein
MADSYSISIGSTFNRWTYLGQDHRMKNKGKVALFRCECGTERFVNALSVVRGLSKSCGCQRVDSARQQRQKHGRSQDGSGSAYLTWSNMIRRCSKPYATGYEHYGGRGIRVCERWKSFENFLADMGERPDGMTLDRYPDTNGNYEPGNCRWSTKTEQAYNKRGTLMVEHAGRRATLAELSEVTGVDPETLRRRLTDGMPTEKIVFNGSLARNRVIEYNGESMLMVEWERKLGLSRGVIEARLRRGKSVEEALAPIQPRHRKK